MFQNYALFPHLDVFDNVAFGLRRQKVAKADVRRRVEEALELVELGGLAGRRPQQLSGGQQQRVALARALVLRPAVLLLDEPLGALDAKIRKQLRLELKALQEEVGITFVFVTHDQEEALSMSDRVAVMSAGRIEQIGTPAEVYESPATVFVADFLGVSNLMDADAESDRAPPEHCTVAVGDFRLHAACGDVTASGPVKIVARPERVQLLEHGDRARQLPARHGGAHGLRRRQRPGDGAAGHRRPAPGLHRQHRRRRQLPAGHPRVRAHPRRRAAHPRRLRSRRHLTREPGAAAGARCRDGRGLGLAA